MCLNDLTDAQLMALLRDSIEKQDGKLYKAIQNELNRRCQNE